MNQQKEMKSFFYKNKFNLKFSVVRESLKKYIKGYENKNLIKKNKKEILLLSVVTNLMNYLLFVIG